MRDGITSDFFRLDIQEHRVVFHPDMAKAEQARTHLKKKGYGDITTNSFVKFCYESGYELNDALTAMSFSDEHGIFERFKKDCISIDRNLSMNKGVRILKLKNDGACAGCKGDLSERSIASIYGTSETDRFAMYCARCDVIDGQPYTKQMESQPEPEPESSITPAEAMEYSFKDDKGITYNFWLTDEQVWSVSIEGPTGFVGRIEMKCREFKQAIYNLDLHRNSMDTEIYTCDKKYEQWLGSQSNA